MQDITVPRISVIIPVYNTQSYLEECLDSILAQTFQDFEIICIDDGSTDNSAEILEKYTTQDNRIHLIKQSHQSAGIARNNGLEMAQGEYIIFLDSDDFFSPKMLETVYQTAKENQSDIVLFNGYRYDDKKQDRFKNGNYLHAKLLPASLMFSWSDVPNYIFGLTNSSPWCKFYAHSFLLNNDLHFSVNKNCNDICFSLLSLVLAQRISAVQENLIYHRINRPHSLQYAIDENPLCFLAEYEDLYQELIRRNLYLPLQTSFRYKALSTIMSYLKSMKTDQSRLKILDGLDSEPYRNLPLKEVPGIDDGNKQIHSLSLQLNAIQMQYHQSLNACAARKELSAFSQIVKADSSIKISVIIPVYNTERYLDNTLASIANQTLRNIEIICINDGSTDRSLEILNHWAEKDDRFIILSQPNRGLGYTRNIGIKSARGKYIYFMDSDDLLELDALQQLTTIMDEKQLDALYFDGETLFEDAQLEEDFSSFQKQYIRKGSYNDIYNGATLLRLLCEAGEYQTSSCLQINRLDFIREHNILFPVGIINEDNLFTFTVMLYAKRVSHVQHVYFKRCLHHGSIMTSNLSFQNVYGYYKSFWEMLQIYQMVVSEIDAKNRTALLNRICTTMKLAQNNYAKISNEDKSARFGLMENLALFNALIGNPSDNKESVQRLNNEVINLTAELKESNEKRTEFFIALKQTKEDKSELTAKLKESNAKRSEFFAQRQKLRQEKIELDEKLQTANRTIAEINQKLQIMIKEKAISDAQIRDLQKIIDEQKSD